jgi:hypothetical protein
MNYKTKKPRRKLFDIFRLSDGLKLGNVYAKDEFYARFYADMYFWNLWPVRVAQNVK